MMEILVRGGTHINVVSCFGEKLFAVDTFEDLIKKIRKDRKLKNNIKLTCCLSESGNLKFQFCKENSDEVLFEFRIVSVT